jgi:cell division protein FtsB
MNADEDTAMAEMVSLIAERDDLRREIDDLRDFEREYRSRLLAFHEDRARALREGKP